MLYSNYDLILAFNAGGRVLPRATGFLSSYFDLLTCSIDSHKEVIQP